jgi:hypothetical protein
MMEELSLKPVYLRILIANGGLLSLIIVLISPGTFPAGFWGVWLRQPTGLQTASFYRNDTYRVEFL